MKKGHLQTMHITFQQICAGERPWTALGNFMNYWYAYAKDRREALIVDPLPAYDEHSLYQHQWVVFCAAAVEWFCHTYMVPCPSWVQSPKYMLSEPWFFTSTSVRKSDSVKQHQKSFNGGTCFAGIGVLPINGNWLNT